MVYITGNSRDLKEVPVTRREDFILQLIEDTQIKDSKPSIEGKIEQAVCIPGLHKGIHFMVALSLDVVDISQNVNSIATVSP